MEWTVDQTIIFGADVVAHGLQDRVQLYSVLMRRTKRRTTSCATVYPDGMVKETSLQEAPVDRRTANSEMRNEVMASAGSRAGARFTQAKAKEHAEDGSWPEHLSRVCRDEGRNFQSGMSEPADVYLLCGGQLFLRERLASQSEVLSVRGQMCE